MIALFLFLLLAPARVPVVDQVYEVPANDWRFVQPQLPRKAAYIHAHYDVQGGSHSVALSMMPREDLERLFRGKPHDSVAGTPEGDGGDLNFEMRELDDYCFVMLNHGSGSTLVHLRIWLEFPGVTQLSPQRQITVVIISFAVFFAIAGFSARRLLRAVRK